MRSFRKLSAAAVCLSLAASALAAKKEDAKPKEPDAKKEAGKKKAKDKDADKKKKSGKDAPEPAGTGEPGKISLPILKDHPAKGLKIPYYNDAGKLQMTFNIGTGSRIDDDHVQMDELFVETYDDDGSPGMMIQLPTSVLDVNTRILSTEKHVTIRRSDFELTGERMEFNTQTKQGKLAGNVRMLIYNLDDETPAPPTGETSRAQ